MIRFNFILAAMLFMATNVLAQPRLSGLVPSPKPVTFTMIAVDGATTNSAAIEISALGGDLAYLTVMAASGGAVDIDVNHEVSYSKSPAEAADWYAPATPKLMDILAVGTSGAAISDAAFIRLAIDATPVANAADVTLTVSIGLSHRRNDNGLGKLVKTPKSGGQFVGMTVVAAASAMLGNGALSGAAPFASFDADGVFLFLDAPGQDGDEVVQLQGSAHRSGPWVAVGSPVTLTADRTLIRQDAPAGLALWRATASNPAGVDVVYSHAFLAY
jgi:hypothetical protein